jgi:hypothetical protein
MALSTGQIRELTLGFYDRATRELRSPSGATPPMANEISLAVNAVVDAGLGTIQRTPEGIIFAVTDEPTRREVGANLRAIFDRTHRATVVGLQHFANQPTSAWAKVLGSSPCVYDNATGEIVALSNEALTTTLERFGRLENEARITDANLVYCKRDVAQIGGAYTRNGDVVVAYMPTVAAAQQVKTTLQARRQPDISRMTRVAEYVSETGIAASLFGATPIQRPSFEDVFAQLQGLTRFEFDRITESVRAMMRASRTQARQDEIAHGAMNGTSPVGVSTQEHLEALGYTRKSAAPNSRQSQEEARRETIRARRRDLDVVAEEQERFRTEVAFREREGEQQYGREIDHNELLPSSEKQGDKTVGTVPARRHFTGTIDRVGQYNVRLRSESGAWMNVPFTAFGSVCASQKAHDDGLWQDGPPPAKLLRAWMDLDATVRVTPRNGEIGIFGDSPSTLKQRLAREKERQLEEKAERAASTMVEDLHREDLRALYASSQAIAQNVFNLPQKPAVLPIGERIDAIQVETTDALEATAKTKRGNREGKGYEPVLYSGPVLDVGDWYFTQYQTDTNLIVPHEILAFGRTPERGQVVDITYVPGESMAMGEMKITGTSSIVEEYVRRFDSHLDNQRFEREAERMAPLAMAMAANDMTESRPLKIATLSNDGFTKYHGQIVSAGTHSAFLYDADRGEVIPLNQHASYTMGKRFERGDEITLTSGRYGVVLNEHLELSREAERLQSDAVRQLLDNRSMVMEEMHDRIARRLIGDRFGVAADELQPFVPERGVRYEATPILVTNQAVYARTFEEAPRIARLDAWSTRANLRSAQSVELQDAQLVQLGTDAKGKITVAPVAPTEVQRRIDEGSLRARDLTVPDRVTIAPIVPSSVAPGQKTYGFVGNVDVAENKHTLGVDLSDYRTGYYAYAAVDRDLLAPETPAADLELGNQIEFKMTPEGLAVKPLVVAAENARTTSATTTLAPGLEAETERSRSAERGGLGM